MTDNEKNAEWSREAKQLGIGSPYRIALYRTARKMKLDKEAALKAAKECNPVVVKRYELGR